MLKRLSQFYILRLAIMLYFMHYEALFLTSLYVVFKFFLQIPKSDLKN